VISETDKGVYVLPKLIKIRYMIQAALEQRIKGDKQVFLLPQFDMAAPRKLFTNPSEQHAPNSKFAPQYMVGATYFFWQVHQTGP